MTANAASVRYGTAHQLEILTAVEPTVELAMEEHKAKRKLWYPNDHLPADERATAKVDAEIVRLRDAARGLPDSVRVAFALNLLTEEGLPHFHRLIAVHFGMSSPWGTWNNLWTAEEDRHGCAMRDYVRDARLFNMRALEELQYQYIEAGFDPEWEHDPYRLLAYTSLQEKATQVSHANTGRMCRNIEPTGQRVLAHIAGDESRHYAFYRTVFAAILALDPNRALQSLQKVTLAFAMPGHNIAGFGDMARVLERAGVFGPRDYSGIVIELLDFWKIGELTGLSPLGREAQDKVMKVPARLNRIADYADAKAQKKTYKFPFIYNRALEI